MKWVAVFLPIGGVATPSVGRAQSDAVVAPALEPALREDRSQAINCLATAIAYEAGHEPIEGQQAVAEVILNRVRHARFPKTVCGVVYEGSQRRTGCQFSFTCDGSLYRRMSAPVVALTRTIAISALAGLNPLRVAGATHYHASYVSPYWAPSLVRITRIGAHIFYRSVGSRDQMPLPTPYFASSNADDSRASTNGPQGETVRVTAPARTPLFAPWGLAPQSASGPGQAF